jgi:hypothetical protein
MVWVDVGGAIILLDDHSDIGNHNRGRKLTTEWEDPNFGR